MNDVISTDRLDLCPMTPEFLQYTIAGQRTAAEALLDLKIPDDWFDLADFAALRLDDYRTGATSQPWLPRAIRLRVTGEMAGFIGFHTPPGPDYLQPLSPGGVEFGYTVFPEHRRQGIALEASRGLMQWAQLHHRIRSFVLSVSPDNTASLGLIAMLGFHRIGSQIDEIDGPEDILWMDRSGAGGLPRLSSLASRHPEFIAPARSGGRRAPPGGTRSCDPGVPLAGPAGHC
jgi:[ribosomal protein S5]-alanine N-acetyltransferase